MFSVLAIAFGMSTDAFAAAISKGAALDRPRLSEALRTGLVFGIVETATPLLGWALGLAASSFVAAIDHWIAFALLGGIGAKMIVEGVSRERTAQRPTRHSALVLAMTAIGTSLDAFAVGVTLAFLDVDVVVIAAAIGIATFAMTTLGVMIGRWVGEKVGRAAEVAGGVVLLGIGTEILVTHLGLVRF
jgi:putative Mn2+ efflux pump MntP